jgi:DNA-binding transcriptional MerR regulator
MSASAVLKLQKAGFTTEQVEALADFMDTQAASKADLVEAKTELKADIAELRSEMKLLEQRMTIKLGSIVFLAVGLLFAAIRYLPAPHP